jgi:hypothetical protein
VLGGVSQLLHGLVDILRLLLVHVL